ncbi:MAG TPA: hypothetical protein VG056_01590 [Pirellulales bacterium]|jgi:hypothetical protein|nr:hypothetical protein [Pirellulales bacterium]
MPPPGRILFYEPGTTLWLADDDSLMLNVLMGRVFQYGMNFALNEQERGEYRRRGDEFIRALSHHVLTHEAEYITRGYRE